MWLFPRRRKSDTAAQKEAQVHAINSEIIQKLDTANKSARKLNSRLDKERDVTRLIWLATGGDHRGRP